HVRRNSVPSLLLHVFSATGGCRDAAVHFAATASNGSTSAVSFEKYASAAMATDAACQPRLWRRRQTSAARVASVASRSVLAANHSAASRWAGATKNSAPA